MHKVLDDGTRILLSLSAQELVAVTNAVRAACNATLNAEYDTTFGVAREVMQSLHASLCTVIHPVRRTSELVEAWEDHGGIMVRVMNTFGDPVELGERAASEFSEQLREAIRKAS